MSSLPLYAFTVYTTLPDATLYKNGSITAAYFQEQGAYTVFKDPAHTVTEAYKTEHIARIVRTEEPVR